MSQPTRDELSIALRDCYTSSEHLANVMKEELVSTPTGFVLFQTLINQAAFAIILEGILRRLPEELVS